MAAIDALLVLTTFGDRERALEVGRTLVQEELAACVNVVPEVASVYRWQGQVQEDREVLCVIKTSRAAFDRLRERLLALHSYELPEVVAIGLENGHPPYLDWLLSSVR